MNEVGVIRKLDRFFRDNPGEELTFKEISIKYGVTIKTARWAVTMLKKSGSLEALYVVRGRQRFGSQR